MFKLVILALTGEILEVQHFLARPTQSQTETFFSQCVKKYGNDIMLQNETVKYANMGKAQNEAVQNETH